MEVIQAAVEHAAGIAAVHVLAWQRAYTDLMPGEFLRSLSIAGRAESWRESLKRDTPRTLVAIEADAVIGFAAFGPQREAGAEASLGELWALYVSPAHWGQGVGRALWLAARERMRAEGYRSVSLWVLAGNEQAIRFYRAAGFEPVPGPGSPVVLGGARLEHVRYVTPLR